MGIDYSALTFSKGPSRFSEKQQRRAEEVKNQRELWAYVTVREHSCCRVCGAFCSPRAIGMLERHHHHHLQYRSDCGMDTKDNVVLICAACHRAIHGEPWKPPTLRLSGDADLRDAVTGRLCGIKIERLTESGWKTERFC